LDSAKDAIYEKAKERVELAAYFAKEMIEELGQNKALAIIEKAYHKYSTNRFAGPYQSLPPDERFAAFKAKVRAEQQESQSFDIIAETDTSIKVRFHRCAVYEVFRDFGIPEVCQKYCDADFVAFPELHPKMRITREHEIAYGDEYCDHHWFLED
jgi:hypothetical protein